MNWWKLASFFIKRASEPYGWWISPEGEPTPVPFQRHAEVASWIIAAKKLKCEGFHTISDLLTLGYARLITNHSTPLIELKKACTSVQAKEVDAKVMESLSRLKAGSTCWLEMPGYRGNLDEVYLHKLDKVLVGAIKPRGGSWVPEIPAKVEPIKRPVQRPVSAPVQEDMVMAGATNYSNYLNNAFGNGWGSKKKKKKDECSSSLDMHCDGDDGY